MTPDQVIVVTTQWRADALGGPGSLCEAPGLAGLLSEATVFTEAVTPHPFGPFARAALLTGRLSPANGVADYFDPLPAETPTLAHRLNGVGYQTAWVGKWHLSRRDPRAPLVGEAHARTPVPPEARGGFGHWVGFESGFLLNDPWLQGDGFAHPIQFHGYQSDVLVDQALAWWKAREGWGPRFLVVSLEAPHPPYHAPFPGEAVPFELPARVPRGGEIERRARYELSGYAGHLAATARAIGRLWEGLGPARTGTHFVFTSVHGDMHGSHGLFRKGWPQEDSIRVPLVVHRPGQTRPARSQAAVSLLDVGRECIEVGLGRPGWTNAPAEAWISMPSVVRLPWQCPYRWSGFRSPALKYIQTAEGVPLFCHDLAADPEERHNLIGTPVAEQARGRLAQLAAALSCA